MRAFRNDILSMKKKHGPPSYFLTLYFADSMWPQGFIEISNGKLSIEQAKQLSVKERAELMANNPVRVTLAWKRRVKAFLDFEINGESKPLGDITHYAQKAEWQGRLSEHVHFLFWTKDPVLPVHLKGNGELDGDQSHITFKAEALGSAILPISSAQYSRNEVNSQTQSIQNHVHSHPFPERIATSAASTASPSRTEIFNSVTDKPCSFGQYFSSQLAQASIRDLVRSVNLHFCSAYCTKNGTQTCKSRFPFQTSSTTKVKKIIDKNLNKNFQDTLAPKSPKE